MLVMRLTKVLTVWGQSRAPRYVIVSDSVGEEMSHNSVPATRPPALLAWQNTSYAYTVLRGVISWQTRNDSTRFCLLYTSVPASGLERASDAGATPRTSLCHIIVLPPQSSAVEEHKERDAYLSLIHI